MLPLSRSQNIHLFSFSEERLSCYFDEVYRIRGTCLAKGNWTMSGYKLATVLPPDFCAGFFLDLFFDPFD
jgi:hypothetical protein